MEEYESLLNREIGIRNTAVVVIIAVILFAVVSLVLEYKNMSSKKEKIVSIVTCAFIVCGCIIFVTLAAVGAADIKKDIDNQDYVVYYGEYEVEHDRNYTTIYIGNGENRVRLQWVGKYIDYSGVLTGYIVYGRNSLIAVDRYD